MRILGIDFASSNMNYVGISYDGETQIVVTSSRMILGGTRERDALVAFQDATKTLLNDFAPDYIAIKAKPESGQMRSGSAALKMEGIVLANAPCPVEFVSGQKINIIEDEDKSLYGYLQPALKAAIVVRNLKSE
jgi:hypothetical protein